MDQKFIRRAAQVREAAKWVSDHTIQLHMLEAALFYDRLAMAGTDGVVDLNGSGITGGSLEPL